MGIDKNSGKGSTVTKNKNRPPLNNKKRARATKIKGELRLPFVLSAIWNSCPCRSWLLAMNDDAVCLMDRGACIASKPAPTVSL
jgi:hypothetical protein